MKKRNVSASRARMGKGYNNVKQSGMSRPNFLRGVGLAATGVGAAAMGLGPVTRATTYPEGTSIVCQDPFVFSYDEPSFGLSFPTLPGFPAGITPETPIILDQGGNPILYAGELLYTLNCGFPPPAPCDGPYPQVLGNHYVCSNKCKYYLPRYLQHLDPSNDFTIDVIVGNFQSLSSSPYTLPDQRFFSDPYNFRNQETIGYLTTLNLLGLINGIEAYQGDTFTKSEDQFEPYFHTLENMKTPTNFTGEQIANYEQDTYRVEFDLPLSNFEVALTPQHPAYVPVMKPIIDQIFLDNFQVPYDPTQFILSPIVKLRGWYTKGRGVDKGNGSLHRPLVIMFGGETEQITGNSSIFARSRKSAAQFVSLGFDVLLLDMRGHGVSQGQTRAVITTLADDIFDILNLLESGTLTDGTPAQVRVLDFQNSEKTPASVNLLPAGAHNTSVIFCGLSLGGMALTHTMLKHLMAKHNPNAFKQRYYKLGLSGPQPENPDHFNKFNFKGMAAITTESAGCGYRGSMAVILDSTVTGFLYPLATPILYEFILGEGFIRNPALGLNIGSLVDSEILNYLKYYPALCVLGITRDHIFSIEGSVEAYNLCRGFKQIHAIDYKEHRDPVDSLQDYWLAKMMKWIVPAANQPLNKTLENTSTTTMEEVVCQAPSAQEGEKLKGRLNAANRITNKSNPRLK